MKKIYIQPKSAIYKIQPATIIADSQLKLDSTQQLNSGDILVHADNSWDIWGTGADDWDE